MIKHSNLCDNTNSLLYKLKNAYLCIKPENVFFVLSIIFGTIILFINPPFLVPDEEAHFYRSYQLSQGILIPYNNSVPSEIYQLKANLGTDKIIVLHTYQSKLSLLRQFFISSTYNSGDKLVNTTATLQYSPIAYFPQSIGILIGRILSLPPISVFYLARIVNFLLSIFLITLALKITPLLKWTFAIIALLPMTLYQLASVSADSITIALNIIYLSLFFI